MLSNHPNCLGGNGPSASSDLIGDVDGPASATDNAVARFDGTTGKLIQNSTVTIADTTGDIAGATSLTSPASTNLTLAGGAGNSSIILTPAGTGGVGIGTTNPSQLLELSKDSGYQQVLSEYSSNTSRADLVFRKARGTAASPSTTAVNDYLGVIDFSGYGSSSFTIGAELLSQVEAVGASNYSNFIFSTREQSNNNVTERMRIANNGTVSISSTTAGSSGAGALVVAGGLSAAGASYFGGAVSVAPAGAVDAVVSLQSASGQAVGAHWKETSIADRGWLGYAAGSSNLVYRSAGYNSATGTLRLTIDGSTGAATFAGAVTANVTASNYISIVSNATNKDAAFKSGDGTNNWYAGLVGGSFGTDGAYRILEQGVGTARLTIATTTGLATFAGTVIAPAATASLAPLRIPHGTAPTSPTNGDMWTTTAGLFIRINGATVGPLS